MFCYNLKLTLVYTPLAFSLGNIDDDSCNGGGSCFDVHGELNLNKCIDVG